MINDSNNHHLTNSFSILTYNVNFVYTRDGKGDDNSKKIFKALLESNADIICLQETHPGFETFLLNYQNKQLSNIYPFIIFRHHGGSGGMAFLSKFKILENSLQYIQLEREKGSWFPMYLIQIELFNYGNDIIVNNIVNNKIIQIVNVHLRPPLNDDGSAQLWTASFTNSYRLEEIKYLLNYLQNNNLLYSSKNNNNTTIIDNNNYSLKYPTIILGDFNENEFAPGITFLTNELTVDCKVNNNEKNENKLFRDALKEFVPFKRETHRWPFYLPFGFIYWSHKRLDHCIYSPYLLNCNDCKVIDGYENGASDHQPVLSSFTLK
ncbi:hypothetical protein ABK040_003866 [Willaertia magna]